MKIQVASIIALLTLVGCASTSGPSKAPDGMALLVGKNTNLVSVKIRSIDNGEILWVGSYKLGNNATIAPGKHSVSVMCEFIEPWGRNINPGTLLIDVEPNKIYKISGQPSSDGKKCNVQAEERT